jgi:hypothetical protein
MTKKGKIGMEVINETSDHARNMVILLKRDK